MSDLPIGWAEVRLEEVATVIAGQAPPGSSYNLTGRGLPLYQGKADFGDLFVGKPRVWTDSAAKTAQLGDVLISVRAPVGPTNVATAECAIGRGLAAVRSRSGIDQRYLLWALRTTEHSLARKATGTTFPAIISAVLRGHPIRLAPTGEQERIVAAIEEEFSRIDAGLTALERVRKRIDALIRKALDAALGLGEPEADGWAWSTIGAIAVRLDYGTSTKTSEILGVPVLRMGNIQSRRISLASLKFLPANHPDVERFILEPGDILFNRTNSPELVGKTAVYEGDPARASFASYLVRVRCDAGALPHWVAAAINCSRGRRYIASVRTQQVGQANVSASKLARMPIQIPDREIQRRRLVALDELDSSTVQLLSVWAALKTKAEALRSTILTAAFSGRLVPQDPNDEPALNLLARIAAQRAESNGNNTSGPPCHSKVTAWQA